MEMDSTQVAWVAMGINALLAILGFLVRGAYVEMRDKMAATIIALESVKAKLQEVEVELPKTYATKQELLQSRNETNAVLREMQADIKQVLIAVGVSTNRAA